MFRKRLLRGLTEINSDIGKLETPRERINMRTNYLWLLALIGVIIVFWNIIRSDQEEAARKCEERDRLSNIKSDKQQIEIGRLQIKMDSIELKSRIVADSLKYRIFEVEMEVNANRRETIHQQKTLIKRANQFLGK